MIAEVKQRKGLQWVGNDLKYKYIINNSSSGCNSLPSFAICLFLFGMNLAFLIPFWNTPARLPITCQPYPLTPPPSLKKWESWAQHTQISRKLLIYNDFPMPKIKKPVLGIASHFGQSIDFKQVFSKILGIVTIRTNAYIVRLHI